MFFWSDRMERLGIWLDWDRSSIKSFICPLLVSKISVTKPTSRVPDIIPKPLHLFSLSTGHYTCHPISLYVFGWNCTNIFIAKRLKMQYSLILSTLTMLLATAFAAPVAAPQELGIPTRVTVCDADINGLKWTCVYYGEGVKSCFPC